jgi:hypothetical protein
MKTNRTCFIIIAILSLSVLSCATKKDFLLSSVVPAARGYVKIDTDKNKNYNIKVVIENLAEVERLASKNSTYVVWMDTRDNDTKNLGQIKSSRKVMSKRLKASLETKSAFKPSRIFITAEDDADVQYPVAQVVLSTEKF